MEEHGLKQSDLTEIGSQGIVSEILRGKRALNVRQIWLLAKRFGISPAVIFIQRERDNPSVPAPPPKLNLGIHLLRHTHPLVHYRKRMVNAQLTRAVIL